MSKGLLKDEDMEPDVGPFSYYIEAFSELSTCRNSGFGLSAIPFNSVIKYCEVFGVEDVEEFLYLIRRMDNTLLELESKKEKSKGRNSKDAANKRN